MEQHLCPYKTFSLGAIEQNSGKVGVFCAELNKISARTKKKLTLLVQKQPQQKIGLHLWLPYGLMDPMDGTALLIMFDGTC